MNRSAARLACIGLCLVALAACRRAPVEPVFADQAQAATGVTCPDGESADVCTPEDDEGGPREFVVVLRPPDNHLWTFTTRSTTEGMPLHATFAAGAGTMSSVESGGGRRHAPPPVPPVRGDRGRGASIRGAGLRSGGLLRYSDRVRGRDGNAASRAGAKGVTLRFAGREVRRGS